MLSRRVAATGLLAFGLVTFAACAGDATTAPAAATLAPADRPFLSLGLPAGATADTLQVGETVQLTAQLASPGKKVRATTWTSSNTAVATVSSAGLVQAVGGGTSTIVASNGSRADSAQIVVLTGAEPAPPPAPAPAPAPAPGDAAAKVFALMGGVPSVAAVEGLGGAFARYESDFRTNAEERWATDGARWDLADYYDRAMIFYVWWARTGDQKYLDRANAIAVDYRTNFLEAKAFYIEPHESQLDGVALHYLVTGDEASRAAVGRVADRFSGSYYVGGLSDTGAEMENRMQARVLVSFLLANYVKAPSQLGNDWSVRARDALTRILASQSADGAYRFTNAISNQCGYNKPFMVGLLNDALIRYHALFEQDARILPAVKKAVDYMWANDWYATEQAFTYLEGSCNGDGPGPAADLNNLISSGFGFVYQQTGDATYKTRGDAVFAGGVYGGWLGSSKHFNQAYTSSYRYVSLRQ